MSKTIKIDETQFKRVVESITNTEIGETHLESEPFKDYADKEQEDLAHGEDHDVKNYENPNLSEQSDEEDEEEEDDTNPLSLPNHFKENEFGQIELEEHDIDELFDYTDGTRRRFTGIIYYDALIPMTNDKEYDKKIAMGVLEFERKKLMNAETYLSDSESVFFRDKTY